jgi:hypothetical protein
VRPTSLIRSVPGKGFGSGIERGASFVMALQFGPDGPVAEGFTADEVAAVRIGTEAVSG